MTMKTTTSTTTSNSRRTGAPGSKHTRSSGELAGSVAGKPATNAAPEPEPAAAYRIFAYGTLRRGFANHDRLCRGVLSIEKAAIVGRLHWLTDRIPMAEVPAETILAEGSADTARDVAIQVEMAAQWPRWPTAAAKAPLGAHIGRQVDPGSPWDLVPGEILTFDDPEVRIPRIDGLEGFRPGGSSFYRRVLVPLARGEGGPVWVYVAPEEGEEKGRWRRWKRFPGRARS